MRRNLTIAVLLLLGCAWLSGCSGGVALGQVDGVVQLNGEPIANVMVTFVPNDPHQPQSMAISDAQGQFQLRCNNGKMGAVVGEHRVTVIDAARAPSGKSKEDDELPEGAEAPPSRVPLKYTRPDKTPLRQSVQPGAQSVTLDLQPG